VDRVPPPPIKRPARHQKVWSRVGITPAACQQPHRNDGHSCLLETQEASIRGRTQLLHIAERICDLVSILERALLRLFGFGLFLQGLVNAVRYIVGR
jgi:hypothetical protein